jgi:hypothetical protein
VTGSRTAGGGVDRSKIDLDDEKPSNPMPMALWAARNMLLTLTLLLGLVVLMPCVGHASRHACRDPLKDAV